MAIISFFIKRNCTDWEISHFDLIRNQDYSFALSLTSTFYGPWVGEVFEHCPGRCNIRLLSKKKNDFVCPSHWAISLKYRPLTRSEHVRERQDQKGAMRVGSFDVDRRQLKEAALCSAVDVTSM